MSAHTHDDVNWAAKLPSMRRADALFGTALRAVADRLIRDLPAQATVIDVGSGSGGMSSALASALAARDRVREAEAPALVLLDAVEELLHAAADAARAARPTSAVGTAAAGTASGEGPESAATPVRVSTVLADAARADLSSLLPAADLVWASSVLHHLPDQQKAVDNLAAVLRPGGLLAVAEGGLDTRCLPWDLGVGEPGLEARLISARDAWFGELRAGMEQGVRMPYGWPAALNAAGLTGVTSFSYLVDHPAPASRQVSEFAVERVSWLTETVRDRLTDGDREAALSLIDPNGPHYLGHRSDVYLLSTSTVHYGWCP
ncbi:methyltransferase [Amycolatopsis palatopharyngis]|uniref:methyltransferase n=1 Tax=Amycolatopsis palatopharyngis TaxID=187982 RepID=UPI000E23A4C2|nr:methyltransferase [Amycolatopsis palatopharyngis]